MKVNQLKIGSLLSYLQMAVSIVIGILYTPIMIRLLGQSEYGLYNTVASTVSMISLVSLGFGSSYVRYFTKYKVNKDEDAIARLNGLFMIIFSVIGLIVLLCGLYLSFNLDMVFDEGLTASEYKIARVLMLLLTFNLAISFLTSVFLSIITANERFIVLKSLGILKTVFGPLVTLPLLLMGYRSIAMVSVTLLISLITDLIYIFYVFIKLKQKFIFNNFEKGLLKNLFVYTSFIAINMVVDQINLNIPKVLLGRYCGTNIVAVYSVGHTLYSYYVMFSTAISGVFTPKIHKIANETKNSVVLQRKRFTEIFIKVGRIQFIILSLIATGIIFFGNEFILNYWVGEEYTDSYYVAVLLIVVGTIPLIQNLGIEIQRALNKHRFRSLVYFVIALINLFCCAICCEKYGAVGATIGTVMSMIIANGVIMNIYYHQKCNIDIVAFWKSIIGLFKGLVVPIIIGLLMNKFIIMNSLFIFLTMILLYVLLFCASMWLFGMNSEEKQLILVSLKAMAKKNKVD